MHPNDVPMDDELAMPGHGPDSIEGQAIVEETFFDYFYRVAHDLLGGLTATPEAFAAWSETQSPWTQYLISEELSKYNAPLDKARSDFAELTAHRDAMNHPCLIIRKAGVHDFSPGQQQQKNFRFLWKIYSSKQ